MTTRQQRRIGGASLVLLGLVFIAAVTANNTLLTGLRFDLTENDLYTISPGTRALLTTIQEPINLYFFFSDSETADIVPLRNFATRVQELLEEFEAAAGNNLNLNIIDPVPFSEDEDRAAQFGLQPISLGIGQTLYFGLAGTNSVGEQQTIGIFNPDRERFLEYELAKMIYSLARPERVVVGLLASVSMAAGFDPQTQRLTEPWVIHTQAGQLFELRTLTPSLTAIDEDVDVLWLVHPKALESSALYAIDQFILRGGRALIFLDPFAEIDMAAAGMDPAALAAGSGSDLEPLLGAWGIDFSSTEVVADNLYALSISSGLGLRPVRHLGLLGVTGEAMDADDVIVDGLGSLNMGSAGHFSALEGSTTELQPLLRSSTEAALLPSIRVQMLADPETLQDDFVPSGESYILAARLTGSLATAFPQGPPEPPVPDTGEGTAEDASDSGPPQDHLDSTEDANVILVGDVDILSDRLWVQRQNFLGQALTTAFAGNGDFVINALDNLSGSAELIGIRARGTYSRPFTRVEALRRQADAQFRQTEQVLQAELAETDRRLSELQAARTDQGSLLMSEEQQAEIQRFLDQQVRIRQDLRAVQRNLDRSIERLGTMLQVANIALVPLLLTLVALAVVGIRRRRAEKRS
ncbi:MAG: Gldg family protein [Rhodospirillaceae bacterium]|nr:Gldg family protein [Rhodospirillaceae bacterium]